MASFNTLVATFDPASGPLLGAYRGAACSEVDYVVYSDNGDRGVRESNDPMHPPEEFLKHAAECELMARFARKPVDKETWKRMAERWHRCAELFTNQSLAARDTTPTRRPIGANLGW